VIADYQGKLDAVPKRESELVELTRDYTTLQASYQGLLAKREDSKVAANLERRNIGEQFKVLDPARVPERPFSPNRLLIKAGGVGGGLAVALLLIAFLEYRDTSFRTDEEVARLCQLPVLAVVPITVGPAERLSLRRRTWTINGAVFVFLVVLGAAVLLWKPQI